MLGHGLRRGGCTATAAEASLTHLLAYAVALVPPREQRDLKRRWWELARVGLAHRALEEVTNTDIKVSATSTPEERERIVQAWMTWWTDHQADFLLR